MKRRSDLTFRHNSKQGRYGWLRLTPAYSLKIVRRYLPVEQEAGRVLDPFCGSGTTPLFAAYKGFPSEAVEINPFLVWFAKVKTAAYEKDVVDNLLSTAKRIISQCEDEPVALADPPPIRNIERWWNAPALEFLSALKGAIETCRTEGLSVEVFDLLYVSFCRTLIKISNAAFDHQSMSFDDNQRQLSLFDERSLYKDVFWGDVQFVATSAGHNPAVMPIIHQGDARNVEDYIQQGIDIVITSPPYPNRMSYIRELRPYMYWLDYLKKASQAGELDWQAIGGTWGAATSRLTDWESNVQKGYYPTYFEDILAQIRDARNKNGEKMANYIARYFEDILSHFHSLMAVLNKDAHIHYVVGNSTFYDVLVPVERLYKEIMELVGLSNVTVEVLRKRNSKKELYEFTVSATYR